MKLEDYELTDKQKAAFKKVIKAMKEAKKTGIEFYGKGNSLCAYQSKAMKHAVPLHKTTGFGEFIPYEGVAILADSGADDMEYFPKGFFD